MRRLPRWTIERRGREWVVAGRPLERRHDDEARVELREFGPEWEE